MNRIESMSSMVTFFFFFFLPIFFLTQNLTLVALELTELEPDKDDLVVDQILAHDELKDDAPAVRKLAQDLNMMKLLLIK